MIGQNIAHYSIVEELGKGGMGAVYRARDTKLRRDVALKLLKPGSPVSDADRARFIEEARAAAALHHPNICTVYDVGEEDGASYISMAYIPGQSLQDIVRRGPMEIHRALDITVQVAEALQAAHARGIVHRDIKPANIIVSAEGRATILDFGIAKLAGQATKPGEKSIVGTVAYMSPEQAKGESVDQQTDIWSLGVCLYEMIAGRRPFTSDHDTAILYQIINENPSPLSEYAAGIPRTLENAVGKAINKTRGRRYRVMSDALADFERARQELAGGKLDKTPSIAVLPFANMSDDEKQTYFCDGMAEEIINSLTQVEGMHVVARTSSFAFRSETGDIREIGRRLDVNTILEGSVQKAGNRLRITTQLVNVGDGYHLWSKRFDRDLEDVFAIQDEIARSVTQALKVTLTDNEKRVIGKVPTEDMQAYDFYTRAMQLYHGKDKKGLEQARNLFTNAIVRDPNYALAYCGLSDCQAMIASFYDSDRSNLESALTASARALELDSELAQVHASRGLALSLDKRYDEAEEAFLLAIEKAPRLFEAYYFYARSCRPQGKMKKAAELFEKASEVRPEDFEAPIMAADTYRGLERPDEMDRWFRLGLAAVEKHVEFHPEEARAWYMGAHAHHALGHQKEALEWSERAIKLAPGDPGTFYNAACLYSLLGETDKCFHCFDRAIEYGYSNRAWLENDPDLESIRSDPRYERLLEQLK